MKTLRSILEDDVHAYLDSQLIDCTQEDFKQIVDGVEYWIQTNLPDAISDSTSSVLDK